MFKHIFNLKIKYFKKAKSSLIVLNEREFLLAQKETKFNKFNIFDNEFL